MLVVHMTGENKGGSLNFRSDQSAMNVDYIGGRDPNRLFFQQYATLFFRYS